MISSSHGFPLWRLAAFVFLLPSLVRAESRIVGGTDSKPFPYYTLLYIGGTAGTAQWYDNVHLLA
jgi:hypothetical protein